MLETVLSGKYWHMIDIVKFFESMEEFRVISTILSIGFITAIKERATTTDWSKSSSASFRDNVYQFNDSNL